jgi:DNA mismatch repair protein MutS2
MSEIDEARSSLHVYALNLYDLRVNPQAFDILEFPTLRELVKRGAQTPMGRTLVDAVEPIGDRNTLQEQLIAVREAVALRERGVHLSFAELADPSDALALLRIQGAALDALVLRETARLCDQALAARATLIGEREAAPVLWSLVADLPRDLNSRVARILDKILPSGELDDRASPELARIRHEINRLRSNITRTLEKLMQRSESSIQDALVTVRNDRFVIPVKADHKSRIGGVAHGFSSSGATVFVEPLETIESNNELQGLRETEVREIYRILASLTDELRSMLPAVEACASAVAELDFVNAKGAFVRTFDCVVPEISSDDALELTEARHPLLEENLRGAGGAVVPVSFTLDTEKPLMVISGANAGGKTVVLKTAGLLSLMTLAGLPVPAKAARVPFYHSVLADIGDHQSLAANLSTFTSHVGNIGRMIEECRAPALVLLDEVGTGTDPEEGSALGVAIVDHFHTKCRAQVMVTTHYRGLKMYAAENDTVQNASVEFDEKTLRPTYRLLTGVAGASSGIDIAQRFGIPATIGAAARDRLESSARDATDYLLRIKREADEAEALRVALEEERAAVAEKYAGLEVEAINREREREGQFEQKLNAALADFDQRLKEVVGGITEKAARAKIEKEVQAQRAELKREAARVAKAAVVHRVLPTPRDVKVMRGGTIVETRPQPEIIEPAPAPIPDRPIEKGDTVRLRTFGSVGIVDAIHGNDVEVRVKNVRLRAKMGDMELVAPEPAPFEKGRGARLRAMSRGVETKLRLSDENVTAELRLIGQTTDEAMDAVDKFLDEVYMNGVSQVRIVHGMGTGALRRVVHETLKGHPHVERYGLAPQNQGGEGATVVELKV